MKARGRLVRAAAVTTWIAFLASGCGLLAPQPDRSRFYTLAPAADAAGGAPGSVGSGGPGAFTGRVIGVGPVKIPGYLDRHEIATRVSPTRVDYAPLDLWAEPLDQSITRVLQADLASLLGGAQVVAWPWLESIDYQVAVEVLRFEPGTPDGANLQARWTIRSGAGGAVLESGRASFAHPIEGRGATAEVAALSATLSDLAQRLASTLRSAAAPAASGQISPKTE